MSALEDTLVFHIRAKRLPEPEREVQLFKDRRWRYDLVWRPQMLTVEVDGGTWVRGAHSRGWGQRRDAEKQNRAVLEGWAVLRFTSDMVMSGEAVATLVQALA